MNPWSASLNTVWGYNVEFKCRERKERDFSTSYKHSTDIEILQGWKETVLHRELSF